MLVVIPDMDVGTYRLEITTQYTSGSLLKEQRTAVFDKELTVIV
ncbi:DUF4469 domain-containing protein [Pseudopedobacter saltans]|nr:DUF4469 domain-containing protein [Pseudopedobacter saltans]